MNRRGFFGAIGAAITAAVIPIDFGDNDYRRILERGGYPFNYDPTTNVWWRQSGKLVYHSPDYAQAEARTIAALERAWKECARTGQAPSQIWITDEQLMELGDEIHRSGRA